MAPEDKVEVSPSGASAGDEGGYVTAEEETSSEEGDPHRWPDNNWPDLAGMDLNPDLTD